MGRRGWRAEGGLTLLEIVIIIAVMGFLAAMVVPFAGHLDKAQRAKMTRERLEAVRTAVTGPAHTYDERGMRVVRGYAGDMDALPKLYKFTWSAANNRWEKPAGGGPVVYEEVYHGGDITADPPHIGQPLGLWEKFAPDGGATAWERWRGPYLGYPKAVFAARDKEVDPLRQTEGVLADAWGRVLFFIKEQGEAGDPNSLYLLLVSAGPDGKAALPPAKTPAGPPVRGADAVYDKTAPENRDNIVLEITPDEWYRANLGVQEEKTRQILEQIRTALLGPPDAFDPAGRRIVGGYIGDLGRLPALWGWDSAANPPRWVTPPPAGTAAPQARGLWVWAAAEGYSDHDPPTPAPPPQGFRWRGPYMQKPWGEGADEVLRDAWGTPLWFALAPEPPEPPKTLTVTSAGRDKKVATGDDNISMEITSDEWRIQGARVRGSVRNETPKVYVEDPPGSGIWVPAPVQPEAKLDLMFYHQPQKEALTSSLTVRAGESVAFELSGEVFAGKRRLQVHMVQGVLKSPEAVAVFIGAGGTQSPVAEKLVIIVESPP